jgi:hypothetical protein
MLYPFLLRYWRSLSLGLLALAWAGCVDSVPFPENTFAKDDAIKKFQKGQVNEYTYIKMRQNADGRYNPDTDEVLHPKSKATDKSGNTTSSGNTTTTPSRMSTTPTSN